MKKNSFTRWVLLICALSTVCMSLAGCMGFPVSEEEGKAHPSSTEGNSKIHFLTLNAETLGVLVECNGQFGMIDSGEDWDFPDGSDPRYPFDESITTTFGFDDEVLSYLTEVGVTPENFEFYIGTHPHSDHIGTADEVIRAFRPKRVYTPEYSNDWIPQEWWLFDNLYVYDNLLEAALETQSSVIMQFDEAAPLYPERIKLVGTLDINDTEKETLPNEIPIRVTSVDSEYNTDAVALKQEDGQWHFTVGDIPKYNDLRQELSYQVGVPERQEISATYTVEPQIKDESLPMDSASGGRYENFSKIYDVVATPNFTLGGEMKISILNYNKTYSKENPMIGGNDISFGVLVECNGKRAFVAGDMDNLFGDEDVLGPQLGKIDLLCLGHHGGYGSNSADFLTTLDPQHMVLPGTYLYVTDDTDEIHKRSVLDLLMELGEKGSTLYATALYADKYPAIVYDFRHDLENNIEKDDVCVASAWWVPCHVYYKNGLPEKYKGTVEARGEKFYFNDSQFSTCNAWVEDGENQYYAKEDGTLQKGWLEQDGQWYYFDADAVMCTNWREIDGNFYYFYEDGRMAVDTTIDGSYVNESGIRVA